MPFPSLYTLVPTVGTALILMYATDVTYIGKMLSWRPAVWVGLVSYSAYLWHQPIFAFTRLAGHTVERPVTFVVLMVAIFVLALITWRFVETPFRNRAVVGRSTVAAVAVMGSGALIAIGIFGYTAGFEFRYLSPAGREFLRTYNGRGLAVPDFRPECDFYLHNNISKSCTEASESGQPTTLIWGDSHAQALAVGLRANFGDKRFFAQVATSGCRPGFVDFTPDSVPVYAENGRAFRAACNKSNATVTQFLKSHPVESVILAFKGGHGRVNWAKMVKLLQDSGVKRAFLVGPVPQWTPSLPFAFAAQIDQVAPVPIGSFLRKYVFENNAGLAKFQSQETEIDVIKILPIEYLCSSESSCDYIVPDAPKDDRLLVFDYGHLSYSGSLFLSKKLFGSYF